MGVEQPRDRHAHEMAEWLDFRGLLMNHRRGVREDGVYVERFRLHGLSSSPSDTEPAPHADDMSSNVLLNGTAGRGPIVVTTHVQNGNRRGLESSEHRICAKHGVARSVYG
jgi:hypothetical protein